MRSLALACLAYLTVAVPSSVLGLLWPSMQLSFHQPAGALGLLLVAGTITSVMSSVATGRVLSRVSVGPLLPIGILAIALALEVEAFAPSLWVFGAGTALFGSGFGAIDAALNAHAASHFGARDINWMHASYGLGATIGPLLVTALLSSGVTWRQTYGTIGAALAALATGFFLARRSWPAPLRPPAARPAGRGEGAPGTAAGAERLWPRSAAARIALVFAAVEAGIESGAGIWGYVFLTAGRGLPHVTAGLAISAYWAMMFAGRTVLGPVAERAGPSRVLAAAVAGVPLGAALMTVLAPGLVAVIGMLILGLAAAPIFPLLAITTAQRASAANATATTRTVSLQVAASTIGSAALPAGMGLAIEAFHAAILAPSLLFLGLTMGGAYSLLARLAARR